MPPIRTPLAEAHEAAGASMVNFSGYWMPVRYGSILDEVRTVRTAAGLFDLCHMGRVRIHGPGAGEWIDRLVTCKLQNAPVGAIKYGLLTREDGTIIDDVLVYREPETWFVCINAGNRSRDIAWFQTHAAGTSVEVEDLSNRLAMIALQGPRSLDVARKVLESDPGGLGYYRHGRFPLRGVGEIMVSRTGYTGEDGFEFYFPSEYARAVWEELLAAGEPFGLRPIGLGARDTLRLEAGMPLYGHEIDDSTTPVEAGLGWALAKDFRFVGGEAIRDLMERGVSRKLVGFKCGGKRVPRMSYPILDGDEPVGEVRSGTYSPTLETNIGTAYVALAKASPEASLTLDLRGTREPIELTELPFYRRPR